MEFLMCEIYTISVYDCSIICWMNANGYTIVIVESIFLTLDLCGPMLVCTRPKTPKPYHIPSSALVFNLSFSMRLT